MPSSRRMKCVISKVYYDLQCLEVIQFVLYFVLLQAAARHQCPYLVKRYEKEFINHGGDSTWLNGVDYTPAKLRAIYDINKILAHRPWLLRKEHIKVGLLLLRTLTTLSMNI